jgi:DNA polymerase-1
MKTLLLIDAHALIHRAFHALPPLTSPGGEPAQALYGLSSILLRMWKDERPDYAAALFDRPEPTFRKKEYAEYKAHRPKAVDELVSQIIKAPQLFNEFHIPGFDLRGFEADDLIGTLVEKFRKTRDLRIVILTGDMDALQLVEDDKVVVRALKTGISDSVIYNKAAVIERYHLPPEKLTDYKALVGDPSDNIPGIPGVGPKTAAAILQKYGSIEKFYANLNKEPKLKEKFVGKEKDAILFKKLSTIERHAPLRETSLEELATQPLQESLATYFRKFGFESLVKRAGFSKEENGLTGETTKREKKKETRQELFFMGTLSSVGSDRIFLKDDFLEVAPKELASSKLKIGFDIKDKVKTLLKKKLVLSGPYFDLGIAAWLLDPDGKKYDAADMSQKLLSREWQGNDEDYVALHRFLEKEIKNQNLTKIFYGIEMPLISVLVGMERHGVQMDTSILKKLSIDLAAKISKLEKEIYEAAGEKININSPKQLSVLLFDKLKIGDEKTKKTKTGQRSTNIDVLESLKNKHPIVAYLLEYRELFKLQSTYILPTIELTDKDARLRTDYVQTGAATGRLSSQNPNLQNIPASSGVAPGGDNWVQRFRSAFVAPKNFLLVAFDYSQLELRILAAVSGDKKMIETFKRGEDIHQSTAAAIFGVKLADVSKDMRRVAKTLNFGLIYGMGADAFSKTAGVSRDEARTFIQAYFDNFPGIKIWHEKIKAEGRKTGFVTNLNGRRRSVKGITYGRTRIASEMERVAINMPIQSLGADIIKLAMVEVSKKITSDEASKRRVAMLLSIHDELLFEIEERIIGDISPRIKEVMESVFSLSVPLTVNIKTGKDWSVLKEQV